ncbi:hypothetical protein JAAARDRAFT_407080 [Jaapia argillacea MUCL 33604]|uniref:C2H2-type domain-containing protein n=1 Tax=Jaapia argillacea MUCL 33604 TaxID=933084 RepID=A0A067PHK8_9AGAM|nr:hypothetical protein JAAARDRAFT_407080 [Jaapia argillacea MUCL 33604]
MQPSSSLNDSVSPLLSDDFAADGSTNYPSEREGAASTTLNGPPHLRLPLSIILGPVPMIIVDPPMRSGGQEMSDIFFPLGPPYDNHGALAEWSLNSCPSEFLDQPPDLSLPLYPAWNHLANDDLSEINSSVPSAYPSSSSLSASPIRRRCDNWPFSTCDAGVTISPYPNGDGIAEGNMFNRPAASTESLVFPSPFDHSGSPADEYSPIAQPRPMIPQSHRGRSEFLAVHSAHGGRVSRSRSRALSSGRSSPYPSVPPSPSVASEPSIYSGSPSPSDCDLSHLTVDPALAVPPSPAAAEHQVIAERTKTAAQNRRKNPAPFVCALCSFTFTRKSNLKDHHRIHTGEQPYACPTCGRPFTRSSDMKRHQGIHE